VSRSSSPSSTKGSMASPLEFHDVFLELERRGLSWDDPRAEEIWAKGPKLPKSFYSGNPREVLYREYWLARSSRPPTSPRQHWLPPAVERHLAGRPPEPSMPLPMIPSRVTPEAPRTLRMPFARPSYPYPIYPYPQMGTFHQSWTPNERMKLEAFSERLQAALDASAGMHPVKALLQLSQWNAALQSGEIPPDFEKMLRKSIDDFESAGRHGKEAYEQLYSRIASDAERYRAQAEMQKNNPATVPVPHVSGTLSRDARFDANIAAGPEVEGMLSAIARQRSVPVETVRKIVGQISADQLTYIA